MDSLDCPKEEKHHHYADFTCYLLFNILNTKVHRFMQDIVGLFFFFPCILPVTLSLMLKKDLS